MKSDEFWNSELRFNEDSKVHVAYIAETCQGVLSKLLVEYFSTKNCKIYTKWDEAHEKSHFGNVDKVLCHRKVKQLGQDQTAEFKLHRQATEPLL